MRHIVELSVTHIFNKMLIDWCTGGNPQRRVYFITTTL